MWKTRFLSVTSMVLLSSTGVVFAVESVTNKNDLFPLSEKLQWISGVSGHLGLRSGKKQALACLSTAASKKPLCELVDDLRPSPKNVANVTSLFDATVLYIGERHYVSDARFFLMKNLKVLHDAGFSTLAMEMWNSTAQADIDAFVNSKFDEAWVAENFKKHWKWQGDTYIELMREAHALGFKILALDSRDDNLDALQDFAKDLLIRDQAMAKVLAEEIQRYPNKKIIALTGKWHAYTHVTERGEQLSQREMLLQQVQVPVSTVLVLNKQESSPYNYAAQALGLSGALLKAQPEFHYTDYIYVSEH